MRYPGLEIHKYYEEEDVTICYPLNPRLIDFLKRRDWIITEKIGEGSVSDVFACCSRDKTTTGVVVLFSNVDFEEGSSWNIYDKLIQARGFPDIFPVIYDVLYTDIPYSDDGLYLQYSYNFEDRSIQVIEKVDMTLDRYILTLDAEELTPFLKTLRSTLITQLKTLQGKGIYYTDLKLDNIGISGTPPRIKLLDIEGIRYFSENFNAEKLVDDTIRYEIIEHAQSPLLRKLN